MITTEIVLRSIKKRNNVVGSPEIDSFSGALRRKRADRGVFITTSSFTSGAKEAAKQLNVALVDGEMLTNLMVQYKVGVQVQQTYELYDIDDDFFAEWLYRWDTIRNFWKNRK